jgi:Tol biopolymer transport system component
MVLFDNKVAIDTTAGVDLATTGTTPIRYLGGATTLNGTWGVTWSPDGRFLAVTNQTAPTYGLQIYHFNGNSAPTLLTTTFFATGTYSASWSPDGRFLAVTVGDGTLRIFRFNGNSALIPVGGSVSTINTGQFAASIAWSPDGRFVAVANYAGNAVLLFRFNGNSTPVLLQTVTGFGNNAATLAWSPDGGFISIIEPGGNGVIDITRFNGTRLATTRVSTTGLGNPYGGAWSPDGRFIAVTGHSTYNSINIYRANGINAPMFVGSGTSTDLQFKSVTWSPDGRFLAIVNGINGNLWLYKFNGTSAPISIGNVSTGGNVSQCVTWSPDGNFIAVVNQTSPGTLHIFRCNYYYTGQPSANQGFSNGLLFGDKAKGSDFDAKVKVLSNATVTVKGMVKDDSF